ncbi:MAG: hypothetical protein WCH99_20990 [Verrucomicrobiota bacterium]
MTNIQKNDFKLLTKSPTQPAMKHSCTTQALLKQIGGGLIWALFFILTPAEVLVLGAVVWIPVLIWRERVRAAHYGFWLGMAARLAVVFAAIVIASQMPTKHEDGRVGPLPRNNATLGELAAAGIIYPLYDHQHDPVRVVLPSATPTRREVMQAITQQTGFKVSILHCGNGATVLFGSGGGRIMVDDREKNEQPRPYAP